MKDFASLKDSAYNFKYFFEIKVAKKMYVLKKMTLNFREFASAEYGKTKREDERKNSFI
jgi:hypothetical protein